MMAISKHTGRFHAPARHRSPGPTGRLAHCVGHGIVACPAQLARGWIAIKANCRGASIADLIACQI